MQREFGLQISRLQLVRANVRANRRDVAEGWLTTSCKTRNTVNINYLSWDGGTRNADLVELPNPRKCLRNFDEIDL